MSTVLANTIADPKHHAGVTVDDDGLDWSSDQPPIESSTRRTSWTGPLSVIGAVIAVLAVGGAVAWKFGSSKLPSTTKDPSDTATAMAAKAPGTSRSFSASAPALSLPTSPAAEPVPVPVPQRVIVPAADTGEARPIEVRADGTVPRSSGCSGQREVNPDDGPVLIAMANAGRGAATAPGGAANRSPGGMTRATGGVPSGNPEIADLQRTLQTTQASLGTMVQRLTGQLQGAQGAAGMGGEGGMAGGAMPTTGMVPGMPGMPGMAGMAGMPGPQGGQGAPTTPGLAPQPQQRGDGGAGLFGGSLQASTTSPVMARHLGNRSMMLPKGTTFTCALKTKVVSAVSGMVGCQVLRNVYSDDGRTVLIERGSHLDGEYRITQVRPGVTRIPTIWTRVRTPNGVVVDVDSPAVGPLGESGLGGHVDNRWIERLGAALLVGFLDDVLKILINKSSDSEGGDTIVLGSSAQQGSRVPEKILESTVNIPPLITQNQGGLVGIYIARDVDFSPVYALRAIDVPGALGTSPSPTLTR